MKRSLINNDGDAVMVTAVMLLSLMLSVGSSYLLNYGEVSGKEDEMLHVTDVEGSLMRMRNSMLTLVTSEDTSTSIINRVTLGTMGNPYIGQARTSGELSMKPGPSNFLMQVVLEDGASEAVLNSVNGAITFTSNNYYFTDREYNYEAGGIFIKENSQYVPTSMPSLYLGRTMTGWTLDMIAYGMSGNSWSASGIESLALRVEMAGTYTNTIVPSAGQVISIRINSESEQGWASGFREFFKTEGFTEGVEFSIDEPADWDDPADHLEIDLLTIETFDIDIGEMEVTLI